MNRGKTAAEMRPDHNSMLFPRRWLLDGDARPWRVWRSWRGVRSVAGDYRTEAEANRALPQLQRLSPGSDFSTEYTGKLLTETDGARLFGDR